jgi:hypothetical protein
VTEAADQAHAVHLAGLFLEPPDQQHLSVGLQFFFGGKIQTRRLETASIPDAGLGGLRGSGGNGHGNSWECRW